MTEPVVYMDSDEVTRLYTLTSLIHASYCDLHGELKATDGHPKNVSKDRLTRMAESLDDIGTHMEEMCALFGKLRHGEL